MSTDKPVAPFPVNSDLGLIDDLIEHATNVVGLGGTPSILLVQAAVATHSVIRAHRERIIQLESEVAKLSTEVTALKAERDGKEGTL